MSRLKNCFAQLAGRPALVTFVTAGDPTLAHTVPAMHAMVAAGANILELGMPFSDPEAEGPVIQASSERALANGVRMRDVLDMVRAFRSQDANTPVVLMGYLNAILAHEEFPQTAQAAGVDGLIIVNLPPEEGVELRDALAACDIDLIYLVAPTTTDERARMIMREARGFVYYVSLKGITGADHLQSAEVGGRLAHLRSLQEEPALPICVGFGIKDADSAARVAAHADGVVVGSALVSLLAQYDTDPAAAAQALGGAVQDLRAGADNPST